MLTSTWTQLDDEVGGFDDIGVVLNDIDGVALVDHSFEETDEAMHILRVETVGGFVDDEELAFLTEVGGYLQSLQLAAGKGAERLVEMQIVETDVNTTHKVPRNHGLPREEH